MSKPWLLLILLVTGMTFSAGPQNPAAPAREVAVTVDASKTGEPIAKLLFGGFVEPATTQLWAEMLYDRKFYFAIDSKPEAQQARAWFRRRGERWRPVGPDEFVLMDTKNPYVGEHTPLIKLESSTPHGIQQAGLPLRKGRSYTGRVVLAGDPGAKVEISLVWGPGPGGRQTTRIGSLSGEYVKFPLKYTSGADAEDGRLEIVGTGNGAFHVGAVSLMPADNLQGYRPGMIRLFKEQGITIARWPGGNFVSAYDWREGLGDPDKRPPHYGPVWPMLESNDVGIDEFIVMCRLLGAEPYVAVNSGFGEARSAAEEVEYCNGSIETPMGKLRAANGHAEPYNVKIWGIGNEMYGPWQYGYMSLNQYWAKHIMFAKAMRAVDPTIKVIASGAMIDEMSWCAIDQEQFATSEWRGRLTKKLPFEYGSHEDWTGGLLANAADYIDYLGEHFYTYPDMYFDAETQRFVDANDPLEQRVRRLANRIAYKFEAWEEYLTRIPSLKGKAIKFALDEWSTRDRTTQSAARGFGRGGMKSPLSIALAYHEMFRHSDMVPLANYTPAFRPVTDSTGDAVGLTVDGLVMKVFRHHLAEKLPVTVTGNSPQQLVKGTVGVDTSKSPSGSPTYPVDVVGALSSDRKTLAISIVNPTESVQELEVSFKGVELRGGGKLWQIAAPHVDAVNVPGEKPAVDIVETALNEVPNKLVVAPLSVNVYEFEVR